MRKIIFSLIALLAFVSGRAIDLTEAFQKIAAIPGAAVTDFPQHDCLLQGLDWGKAAMLMGAPAQTAASIDSILSEITDAESQVIENQAGSGKIFTQSTADGRVIGLIYAKMTSGNMNNYVIMLAQGGDDLVETLKL